MTSPSSMSSKGLPQHEMRQAVRKKILWRIMPLLILAYFVNYLDRSNLSIAGPHGMNEDLGLTGAAFGLASGVFFIGYITLGIPSNLALQRFGARRWLAPIMIVWGIVAAATAFVPNVGSLYVMRFLLGVAESGFTPGIVLYLTYWFPQRERARANALFLIGIPLSSVIGTPLASMLVQWGGHLGWLDGWRFMILMTGIPAIIVGVLFYGLLKDSPAQAKWLSAEERTTLMEDLQEEAEAESHQGLRAVLGSARAWMLGLGYAGLCFGLYAISFFLPTIIAETEKTFGVNYSVIQQGLLVAVPYGCAVIFQLIWSAHSRRTGELPLHIVVCALMGTVGILIAAWASSPFIMLVGVSITAIGICAGIGIYFGMVTSFFGGAGAGSAVALTNSIGMIGSFFGPYIFGWLHDLTGGDLTGLLTIAGLCLIPAIVTLVLRSRVRAEASRR